MEARSHNVSGNKQYLVARAIGCPKTHFFLRTRDLLVSQKTTQRHLFFSTLHPLSTVIFATETVLAFVLLLDSRFNFHCYTQREATPTQKSARKCAATSRDFLRERLQSAFTLANSFAESPNIHSYGCVQYFRVFTQCMHGYQCLRFLACTQMFMNAIAHGGCRDTVRESALKDDPGRNLLAALGTRTCVSVAPGLFSQTL